MLHVEMPALLQRLQASFCSETPTDSTAGWACCMLVHRSHLNPDLPSKPLQVLGWTTKANRQQVELRRLLLACAAPTKYVLAFLFARNSYYDSR